MKKALSIILCLSMLMMSFPVSVFAAPEMTLVGGGSSQEIMIEDTENQTQQNAESTEKDAAVLDEESFTVSYNSGIIKNTLISGMPAKDEANGTYTLANVVPTRSGYHFEGWVEEPGADEIITEAVIAEDTTFYAKWAKLLKGEEFKSNLGNFSVTGGLSGDVVFQDGCVVLVYDGSNTQGCVLETEQELYDNSVAISDIEYVEVRFKLANFVPAKSKGCVSVYVQGKNEDGSYTAWDETAKANIEFDYNLAVDGFYSLRIPMSSHSATGLSGNLDRYKICFNPNGYATQQTVLLDHIRFVGKLVDVVEIFDVSEPTAKEAASTTVSVSGNEFIVTESEWSPALLGGLFFDSNEVYTYTATVQALGNGYMPNIPAVATINGAKATYTFNSKEPKKAKISLTFDATEDVGELELVDIVLHERDNDGESTITKQIVAGSDFNVADVVSTKTMDGYRWEGWAATEGATVPVTTVNVTEETHYYAIYTPLDVFDYSNKYHLPGTTANVDGVLTMLNGWAVMTPTSNTQDIKLITPKTCVNAADYGKIEVIYDGSTDTTVGGVVYPNKFDEDFAPALYFEVEDDTYEAQLYKVEGCIAGNRVSYKYIYDMMLTEEWAGEVGSIILDPYDGYPVWSVRSITFVKNDNIEEALAITDVEVPKTWGTPDYTVKTNANYVVESVEWSPEFNDHGKFKAATPYTLTVVVKPESGHKIVTEEATINESFDADATINEDGSMTVSYTFAATDPLVDFELSLEDGVIDVADATYAVTPIFTPVNENESVPMTDIILEIIDNGASGNCAFVVDNNTIQATFDGTITIKATSVYDPSKTATATIEISNQVENYTIKYVTVDEGNVSNMPSDDVGKLDYKLSNKIPTRAGFKFAGWVKNPGDKDSITKDYITKDTTYYALWVKGVNYEFFDFSSPTFSGFAGSIDRENGVYTSSSTTSTDPQIYVYPDRLPGAENPTVEVRLKTTAVSPLTFVLYFTSVDANGNYLGFPYGEDPDDYISNIVATTYNSNYDGYTTIKFDMTSKPDWVNGYITSVRLDPYDGSVGSKVDFDYIRIVCYETDVVEIGGIDTPVAKKEADTTATSLTDTVEVVDVKWDDLLYGYYFDGGKEYTVRVTVKGAPGYFVSSAPMTYQINGEDADGYEYDVETGYLTVYKTFDATGEIASSEAYNIIFAELDADGEYAEESRQIFKGDSFKIGSFEPANIPLGYRWIGWSDEDGNEYIDEIVVDGDATYYAMYELITEFDYANSNHWFGTTSLAGDEGIRFEDDLAIVEVPTKNVDTALITPVTNLNADNFDFVEVYYSAILDGYVDGVQMSNIFNATLINPIPALKFSTPGSPDSFKGTGTLVSAERVMVGSTLTYKYTYDMTTSADWTGVIGKFYADPYTVGSHIYPDWGIRKIAFIPNTEASQKIAVEVDAPETWLAPATADEVTVNSPYKVNSITWTGELNEDGKFLPETPYSVEIVICPDAGYTITATDATINNEEALATKNDDGTYTITCEFGPTESLDEVEVVISGDNEISEDGKYIDLTGKTVSINGNKLPVTTVTWSVDDDVIASVSENGRVYPFTNGTLIVTATSVYDPSVSADFVIEITNQSDLFTVTFDKNTTDNVVGIPDEIKTRGTFIPEEYPVEREGYFFMGWSTDEDALNPSDSFNIKADTVLYANWAKGYEWSFDSASTSIPVFSSRDVTYRDGVAHYSAAKTENDAAIIMHTNSSLYAMKIPTAAYQSFAIRVSLPVAGSLWTYTQSKNSVTGATTPYDESANTRVSNLSANAPGTFQIVNYDMSEKACWNTYDTLNLIRVDSEVAVNNEIAVDWVRIYNAERTVKFDGNGGTIPLYDGYVDSYKQVMKRGLTNIRSVPIRDGYTFVGWSKNPDSFEKIYKGSFTVTDDVTLYAMWTPCNVYYNMDEEEIEQTVSVTEGEMPDDMTVDSDNTGLSISSESEVTPVVKVSDEIEVNDVQKTLVATVDFEYSSLTEDAIYLSFIPEGATEPVSVMIAQDLGEVFGGNIICDLSGVDEYTGTVKDVKLVLQKGVITNYTISEVIITDEESAENLGDTSSSSSSERKDVIIGGIDDDSYVREEEFPAGGGTIVSHKTSTTTTPNKTIGGTDSSGSDSGSDSASTATYVQLKTSASGDVVFEFDDARDDQLFRSFRYMNKEDSYNSIYTIKCDGVTDGSLNMPAFFFNNMYLNADTHRYLIIRNCCMFEKKSANFKVHFTSDGKFSNSMSVNGVLSTTGMGYSVIDMSANENWKGTITGMYFSFNDDAGLLEIDSIIFSNNKDAVSRSSNKFPFVNSFMNSTFTDVTADDWFCNDVQTSYKLGLMNGKDEGKFDPNGNVTLAEAITIASRTSALYKRKTIPAATAGQKWYDPYVAYATTAGIIKSGQYTDLARAATRSEVAVMFASAVPSNWYTAKNRFSSIPDLASSDAAFSKVLLLYNAGVIVGVDKAHNFQPTANIKRSEISAIINRVALPENRQRVYLAFEIDELVMTFGTDVLVGATLNGCDATKLVLKDGLAYGNAVKLPTSQYIDPVVSCTHLVGSGFDASLYKTIEVGVKFGDTIPVGTVSNIYFTTQEIGWSGVARVGATYSGVKNDKGITVLKFNMATNENWKGTITNFRFDPFDMEGEFSISYIKLIPSVE